MTLATRSSPLQGYLLQPGTSYIKCSRDNSFHDTQREYAVCRGIYNRKAGFSYAMVPIPSMILVPEAGLLPVSLLPHGIFKLFSRCSWGNPFRIVQPVVLSRIIPEISQCPVVVSRCRHAAAGPCAPKGAILCSRYIAKFSGCQAFRGGGLAYSSKLLLLYCQGYCTSSP